MLVTVAYGQPRHMHHEKHHQSHQVFEKRPKKHHRPHKKYPREIRCKYDAQQLPNGCYVRVEPDRVKIHVKPSGRMLFSGDEVWLLPSGYYSVHEMGFWHIYDPQGERLFGLTASSRIEQVENGYFIYRFGGFWQVADRKGKDVFGLSSSDEIVYVGDGLFRVKWGGSYRYYNERGKEVDL